MKNHYLILAGMIALVLTSGCAAGRNYQPDIDTLNAKTSSMQGQLEAKNDQISSLQDELRACQNQFKACQTQLELTARSKKDAEARLYQALDKLASGNKSGGSSVRTVVSDNNTIK